MQVSRSRSWLVAAVFGLAATGGPVDAETGLIEVDMQLVLAVDISFSISPDEQDIQRRGYVAAFSDPEVIRAVTSGYRGRIAVTYLEWAGEGTQFQTLPWTVISDQAGARAFAARLVMEPIKRRGATSISNALGSALELFRQSPFVSERMVVDISGDGFNNIGPRVDRARDTLVYHGVTINGLPLMASKGGEAEPSLAAYYQNCVIGGLGAFMLPMLRWEEFGPTLKKKLIAEIAGPAPGDGDGRIRVYRAASRGEVGPKADCLFGEKKERREYIRQLEKAVGKDRAPRWLPREQDWSTPE